MLGFEIEIHMAAHGDFVRAVERVLKFRERAQHLFLALDVHLVGVHAHAVLVRKRLAGLNAHQNFLRTAVLLREVVAVVGAHEGNVQLVRKPNQPRQHLLLLREAVILKLNIEMIFPKNIQIHARPLGRQRRPPLEQRLRKVAGQARRQRDQPARIPAQRVVIHAGLVVEAAREALAHQLDQVLIALLRFAQKNQMAVVARGAGLVLHVRAHIHLAADHRMNAAPERLLIKVHHAVHHAVVGDGARVHAQRLHAVKQVADAVRAVQQTVFGVHVKMCKHGRPSFPHAAAPAPPCRSFIQIVDRPQA